MNVLELLNRFISHDLLRIYTVVSEIYTPAMPPDFVVLKALNWSNCLKPNIITVNIDSV